MGSLLFLCKMGDRTTGTSNVFVLICDRSSVSLNNKYPLVNWHLQCRGSRGSNLIGGHVDNISRNWNAEPTRAEKATVKFFNGLEVDGYRMPDSEFRVGLEGASKVLGFAPNWLYRTLTADEGKTLKVLREYGFDAYLREATVARPQGGTTTVETISLDSFNICIVYAVQKKKKAALALQLALTKMALIDFFRDAFGDEPLSIVEKRRLFYETYAATISPEDWRQMDRLDIVKLALPGDEAHLLDGQWYS